MAEHSTNGVLKLYTAPATTYNFTTAFDKIIKPAIGGVIAKSAMFQIIWDSTNGTPITGFDGVLKFYISNESDPTADDWTEVTNSTIPLGFPIDATKGVDSVSIKWEHKSARVVYIDNSNAGIGTFSIKYLAVTV